MDRRYYRKYENYDLVVPRPEDFPVLNADNKIRSEETKVIKANQNPFKTDDIVLLAVLVILLMEEEKDWTAIFSIGALLFADYIF